jgi:hypothetical protein
VLLGFREASGRNQGAIALVVATVLQLGCKEANSRHTTLGISSIPRSALKGKTPAVANRLHESYWDVKKLMEEA